MTASAAPNNPGSETFTILVKLSELWWDCWPAQYGSMDVTLAPFYVDEISEAEPEKGKNRTKFLGLNVPNKILTLMRIEIKAGVVGGHKCCGSEIVRFFRLRLHLFP